MCVIRFIANLFFTNRSYLLLQSAHNHSEDPTRYTGPSLYAPEQNK
jgi:hypothetical protein